MFEGVLQNAILIWMALLSAAGVGLLFFWRKKTQSDADVRETLLFRLGQLETRMRSLEEQNHSVAYALALSREAKPEPQEEVPSAPEPVKAEPTPHAPQMSPQVAEILKRSGRGQTVLSIAQEMGLGQGEVQLILSLDNSNREKRR